MSFEQQKTCLFNHCKWNTPQVSSFVDKLTNTRDGEKKERQQLVHAFSNKLEMWSSREPSSNGQRNYCKWMHCETLETALHRFVTHNQLCLIVWQGEKLLWQQHQIKQSCAPNCAVAMTFRQLAGKQIWVLKLGFGTNTSVFTMIDPASKLAS